MTVVTRTLLTKQWDFMIQAHILSGEQTSVMHISCQMPAFDALLIMQYVQFCPWKIHSATLAIVYDGLFTLSGNGAYEFPIITFYLWHYCVILCHIVVQYFLKCKLQTCNQCPLEVVNKPLHFELVKSSIFCCVVFHLSFRFSFFLWFSFALFSVLYN